MEPNARVTRCILSKNNHVTEMAITVLLARTVPINKKLLQDLKTIRTNRTIAKSEPAPTVEISFFAILVPSAA